MARVLIIDDEALARLVVSAAAQGMGCEVAEAEDGVEGIRKFQETSDFDLVITVVTVT